MKSTGTISSLLSSFNNSITSTNSINIGNINITTNNTIIPVNNENITQLDNYSLSLINKDREKYGLKPVALSDLSSAQQHADSMLSNSYFSHWDLYGMKPYMRYTLLGGKGYVQENIAVEKSSLCSNISCVGNINVTKAIANMEYSMMYNDSICCNNGHRDNILNPNHNYVNIGVAFNSSTVYFVEDFTNNYINWSNGSPAYLNTNGVYLFGNLTDGLLINSIYISYDKLVNYTSSTVPSVPYSFGTTVAGVVPKSNYYYPNLTTIVANYYYTKNNTFKINFVLNSLIKKYGQGVYTVITSVQNKSTGSTFIASDYSIFINSTYQSYIPRNV